MTYIYTIIPAIALCLCGILSAKTSLEILPSDTLNADSTTAIPPAPQPSEEAESASSLKSWMKTNFTVKLNGTVRGKFEYQPEIGKQRFQVRNSRFSLSGKVTPIVSYKAEIDLSDEGSIKMLDAYIRTNLVRESLRFTIGQMRVPFTIDAHRSPHEQFFANRSFIAKQVGNVRDVGATLNWKFGKEVPISLAGGLFNGSGLTAQKDFWTNSLNYSAKAEAKLFERLCISASIQKTDPAMHDILMYDGGLYYEDRFWHIEAEYLHKTYENNLFKDVDAVNAFICRDIPLKKVFSKISVLARYDFMSDHSEGKQLAPNGMLTLDDPQRHRVTGGLTLSLGLPFTADIRLNYESYFYRKGVVPAISEQDKLVLEFMVRF